MGTKITVCGLGLGYSLALLLTDAGYDVVGIDINPMAWQKPRLDETMNAYAHQAKTIKFATNYDQVRDSDICIIFVSTPLIGTRLSADNVDASLHEILSRNREGDIVILSTMPIGGTQRMLDKYPSLRERLVLCVPPNTLILGDNLPAEKVQVGARAFGHDGQMHMIQDVHHRHYHGKLAKIRAIGCLPILATPEHPLGTQAVFKHLNFRSHRQHHRKSRQIWWKRATDIRLGDYLLIPKLQQSWYGWRRILVPYHGRTRHIMLTQDIAWLLGLWVAEGSAYTFDNPRTKWREGRCDLTLGRHEKDLAERAMNILDSKHAFRVGASLSDSPEKGMLRLRWGSLGWTDFLRAECGIHAQNKRIPEFILTGPTKFLASFLQGYSQGDGYFSKKLKRVVLTTTSKTLALQLQLAFGRFNAWAWVLNVHQSSFGMRYDVGVSDPRGLSILGLLPRRSEWHPLQRGIVKTQDGVLTPVTRVESIPYEGEVYNFAIDKSNSFLISNVASHNCPPQVRQGFFYPTFTNPPLQLVGCETCPPDRILSIYKHLQNPRTPYLFTNFRTVEVTKLVINAFLANKIVFSNAVADYCKVLGIDGAQVMKLASRDPRIGSTQPNYPTYTVPGNGFAGPCLPRDIEELLHGLGNNPHPKTKFHGLLSTLKALNSNA